MEYIEYRVFGIFEQTLLETQTHTCGKASLLPLAEPVVNDKDCRDVTSWCAADAVVVYHRHEKLYGRNNGILSFANHTLQHTNCVTWVAFVSEGGCKSQVFILRKASHIWDDFPTEVSKFPVLISSFHCPKFPIMCFNLKLKSKLHILQQKSNLCHQREWQCYVEMSLNCQSLKKIKLI